MTDIYGDIYEGEFLDGLYLEVDGRKYEGN